MIPNNLLHFRFWFCLFFLFWSWSWLPVSGSDNNTSNSSASSTPSPQLASSTSKSQGTGSGGYGSGDNFSLWKDVVPWTFGFGLFLAVLFVALVGTYKTAANVSKLIYAFAVCDIVRNSL